MSAKIFASLGEGLSYPFKHFGQCLVLFLVFIIEALVIASSAVVLPLGGGGTAGGIALLVIAVLINFFIYGTIVKILGKKEKVFSLFGNVGRGFQLVVISLIYQIITIIVIVIACALGAAATIGLDKIAGSITPDAAWGVIAGFGIWAVIILILSIFFSIFMMPAIVNFARQGKFGAAFHFGEIFAMIGEAKWYKILLGIIAQVIAIIILMVIIGLIAGALMLIPGPAGGIISAVVGLILTAGVLLFSAAFWAAMFNPENH